MRLPLRAPAGMAAAGTCLAIVLSLLLAGPASAAPRGPVMGIQGVVVDRSLSQASIDRELGAMRAVGARMVRIELSWAALEPTASGVHDPAVLGSLDRVVGSARRHGLRILLFINHSPCWASSAPADVRGDCSGPNANREAVWRYGPADAASAVPVSTFVASRYGKQIEAFEIWNEPDQSNELYWAGPNKVRRYVDLVQALYGPLKRANPSLQVLAGAFVGTDGRWLEAMYQDGVKGYYDGLSVHFYGAPLYGLLNTRRVQKAHGDAKPLWLAEFGWTSCLTRTRTTAQQHRCVSRAVQARNDLDLLRAVRTKSWIRAAILFTLRDGNDGYQFGVLDARGRRKPSWTAVHRAMTERRPGRMRAVTVRVARRGGRIVVTGSGSGAEAYGLWAFVGRAQRFSTFLSLDRSNRFRLVLPASVGTRNVAVLVSGLWDGRQVIRRVG